MKSRNEFTTKEEYNEYLRTYFAGLAMQGFCSNQEFLKNLNGDPNLVTKACIEIADELLKQLENE